MQKKYCVCGLATEYDLKIPQFCSNCGQSFMVVAKIVPNSRAKPNETTTDEENDNTPLDIPDKIELEEPPVIKEKSHVLNIGDVLSGGGLGISGRPPLKGKKGAKKRVMSEFKQEASAIKPSSRSHSAKHE